MSRPAPNRQPPLFTPVPVRARRDGWTLRRQALFIFTLCQTRCVDEACRQVGLSQQSAYKLRARADAASFRTAWDQALAVVPLPADFTGRAVGGTARPITYAGRIVGERRRYDNRLGMFLVQAHARRRAGSDSPADVARIWPTSAAPHTDAAEQRPRCARPAGVGTADDRRRGFAARIGGAGHGLSGVAQLAGDNVAAAHRAGGRGGVGRDGREEEEGYHHAGPAKPRPSPAKRATVTKCCRALTPRRPRPSSSA